MNFVNRHERLRMVRTVSESSINIGSVSDGRLEKPARLRSQIIDVGVRQVPIQNWMEMIVQSWEQIWCGLSDAPAQ